jgi:hypothetical protein
VQFGPALRRAVLVSHVVTSLGWMGAVAAFLVLAAMGLTSRDDMTVRSAYIAMQTVTRFAILPLCWATLAIGIIQSLGTRWGLFRHYWIIAKLVITVLSTAILLLHTQPIAMMADIARTSPATIGGHRALQTQLVADSALAIVALLLATVFAVYKPKGVTPYGWRQLRREQARASHSGIS